MAFFKDTIRGLPSGLAVDWISAIALPLLSGGGAMSWGYLKDAPIWALPTIFILTSAAVLWIYITIKGRFWRHNDSDIHALSENLQEMRGVNFSGQSIRLDGRNFIDCIFKDCSVQYDGGAFSFTNCKREPGRILFTSQSREIINVMHVLKFVGLLRDETTHSVVEVNLDAMRKK